MDVRFENGLELVLAGISERYNHDNMNAIPAQWERFSCHIDGRTAYGVVSLIGSEGVFDYLCGVEAEGFRSVPAELVLLRIAAQYYAVFTHSGHISGIRSTWQSIFMEWLPNSGYEVVNAPRFERYSGAFDAQTGFGRVEIWIPVAG
jgi:AraC family transcriptional regulator